jgi:hypothetical protein
MLQALSLSLELPDAMKNAAAYGGIGSPSSKIKGGFGTLYGNLRDSFSDSWGGNTLYNKKATKSPKDDNLEDAENFAKSDDYYTEITIPESY